MIQAQHRLPSLFVVLIVFTLFFGLWRSTEADTAGSGPYQATGIRIGEVTSDKAMVWTRLTRNAERVGQDAPMPKVTYKKSPSEKTGKSNKGKRSGKPIVSFPEGYSIDTIEGAVPGVEGDVRVVYKEKGKSEERSTQWKPVNGKDDFIRQFRLSGLQPNTRYTIRVECRSREGASPGQTVTGRFQTAPKPDQTGRVVFTVSTGQAYGDHDIPGRGYKIYPEMLKLDPSFFVHTGDILYYDKLAKTLPLARWHWARMYSFPTNVEFHRQVSSYFIKDDHDAWRNDCWPTMVSRYMGEFTFEQGLKVFREQVPMGDLTYRTVRWGKDLQIWLVEGRDYRSSNNMPDGPDKTIWGKEQMAWFKRTVRASDATFKLLISPTPVVGPDRENKNDNHSNKGFAHEGNEIRRFIAGQKNMYVACGDRHWQYVSVDGKTGVREYSCGPASDQHAGGWKMDDRRPEHRYLNVVGGFLAGIVDRQAGNPTLTFRHYGVDGDVLNEDVLIVK